MNRCRELDKKQIRYWICQMATGKCMECPFKDFANEVRADLMKLAEKSGFARKDIGTP